MKNRIPSLNKRCLTFNISIMNGMQNLSKMPLWLLASFFFLTGCMTNQENAPDIPELPSQESFMMDMSLFEEGEGMALRQQGGVGWGAASACAESWTFMSSGYMQGPMMGFGAMMHDEPHYDEDKGAWVWTSANMHMMNAFELHGRPEGDEVHWEMWMTAHDGENFLWCEGQMGMDGSWAEWHLNKSADEPQTYLTIQYQKNAEEGTPSLTYSSTNGNYIAFGEMAEGDFVLYYHIYDARQEQLFIIEWNRETKAGRLTTAENETHCWNSSREDVDC
jgi:hypothetical protein